MALPPAVAMSPPAPPQFYHLVSTTLSLNRIISQRTTMMLRNLTHHPVRAVFTALGISLATAILVVSLYVGDTMEHLIDVTYFRADRQDATVAMTEKRPYVVTLQVARLPGVGRSCVDPRRWKRT